MSARAIERARADLAAGVPWRARVRLEGSLANDPTNAQVLELLGEICFEMRDLPAAGRYWFLTERRGADVERAQAAMRELHPTPSALFAALPVKAPPERYPPAVRARLEELVRDERTRWLYTKKLEGSGRKRSTAGDATESRSSLVGTAVALAVLAPWVIGLVTLVVVVVRLLARVV